MFADRMKRLLALGVLLFALGGCGLLDVDDLTAIKEADLASPDGADLLYRRAVASFYVTAGEGARASALAADELLAFPTVATVQSGTWWQDLYLDLRNTTRLVDNWFNSGGMPYASYQNTRLAAIHALAWFEKYGAPTQRGKMAHLMAIQGYTILGLAEQVCAGFAIHEMDGDKPKYNEPLTTEEAFERALVLFDSAIVDAADSAQILNLARVLKGRALLGLGRFAEAAQAVASVPTDFTYRTEYNSGLGQWNPLHINFTISANKVGVADRKGGNGLDFISANDPRIELDSMGVGHDGVTVLYASSPNQGLDSPFIIASGREARLIEAEAALQAGSPTWLTILNDLRLVENGAPAGLAPLTDPGTPVARVDLLFRERAFWLFLTGHRLGDLRRLVDIYGRSPESVFPTGPHIVGGVYTNATSIPFAPAGEARANTGVTGCKE